MVMEDSMSPLRFVSMSRDARQALDLAAQAAAVGSRPLGLAHLLFGVIDVRSSAAKRALQKLSVDVNGMYVALAFQMQSSSQSGPTTSGLERSARRAIEHATSHAVEHGRSPVSLIHLLAGVATVEQEVGDGILQRFDVRPETLARFL